MTSTIISMPVERAEAALRRALWAGRVLPPAEDRQRILEALVVQPDGCWVWPGRTRKSRGRTSVTVAGRRVALDVHRAMYVLAVAPIAPGHLVSQRCGESRCARPDHMELVTPRQLFERGVTNGRIRPLRGWLAGHGGSRRAA